MHKCVRVCRPEVTYRILPQLLSVLNISRQGLSHWTWTSPFQLHGLAVELWGSACPLPVLGLQMAPNMQLLHACWRSELRSSCFHNTTHWTTTTHISGFFVFFFFLRAQEGKFRWLHEVCNCLLACLFVHMLRSHSLAYYGLEFRIQYVSPPASASWVLGFQACTTMPDFFLWLFAYALFFYIYAFVYVTLGQGLGCILCSSRWWAKLKSLALGVLPCWVLSGNFTLRFSLCWGEIFYSLMEIEWKITVNFLDPMWMITKVIFSKLILG